jgi:hypothetical protein
VTLRASFSGAKNALGDAESSLGDAESSLGDAKSSLGGAKSSLGDAKRWRVPEQSPEARAPEPAHEGLH